MPTLPMRFKGRDHLPAVTLFSAAIGALAPLPAYAHFALVAPACYSAQDSLGLPQKSAPCGQADPGTPVVPTGAVTTYRQGQAITLTISEKVFHPGHYRVSIAPDQASLAADPTVTAGATACGSTVITANPTLPLVADGLLVHTTAFTSDQSVQVTLPPNLTCTNCVLQVSEFMSNHGLNNPGGCFYHHCATISILPAGSDGGTTSPDLGSTGADLGSTGIPDAATPPPPIQVGCGCRIGAASATPTAFGASLFALGMLLRRRRRSPTGL